MPYKLRNDRRHKFNKVRYKITNWPEYNEALKKRGSITLWLSQDIIKAWYAKKNKTRLRGRQLKYSDISIEAALIIKTVYGLPYRATEGFMKSIIHLMKIDVDVPDYTRICRRAKSLDLSALENIDDSRHINAIVDSTGLKIFGQGLWHEEKHGLKKRREYRKLHLTIDRETQAIIAQELTTNCESDVSQVGPMLENIKEEIASVSADGAYDSDEVYKKIAENADEAVVIAIPPRKDAALSAYYDKDPTPRDHNILFEEKHGRYRWNDYSDYNYRALVETAMFRYKKIIGDTMYSRDLSTQKVESRISCLALNKMTALGMPKSVKIKKAA